MRLKKDDFVSIECLWKRETVNEGFNLNLAAQAVKDYVPRFEGGSRMQFLPKAC
jgi:hypothetical protein